VTDRSDINDTPNKRKKSSVDYSTVFDEVVDQNTAYLALSTNTTLVTDLSTKFQPEG